MSNESPIYEIKWNNGFWKVFNNRDYADVNTYNTYPEAHKSWLLLQKQNKSFGKSRKSQ